MGRILQTLCWVSWFVALDLTSSIWAEKILIEKMTHQIGL